MARWQYSSHVSTIAVSLLLVVKLNDSMHVISLHLKLGGGKMTIARSRKDSKESFDFKLNILHPRNMKKLFLSSLKNDCSDIISKNPNIIVNMIHFARFVYVTTSQYESCLQ